MGFSMFDALKEARLPVTPVTRKTISVACEGLFDKSNELPEGAAALPEEFADLVVEFDPVKFRRKLVEILEDERAHRVSNPATFEVDASTLRGLRQLIRWLGEQHAPGRLRNGFDSLLSQIRPAGTVHDPLAFLISHL